jgi:hypothetical protein
MIAKGIMTKQTYLNSILSKLVIRLIPAPDIPANPVPEAKPDTTVGGRAFIKPTIVAEPKVVCTPIIKVAIIEIVKPILSLVT